MPLYDFECPACGEKAEKLLRADQSGDKPPCPACSTPMERQLGAFNTAADCGAGCAPGGGFT